MLSEDRISASLASERGSTKGSSKDVKPIDRQSSIDEEEIPRYDEANEGSTTDDRLGDKSRQQRDQQFTTTSQQRFPSRSKTDYSFSPPNIRATGTKNPAKSNGRTNASSASTATSQSGTSSSTPSPGTNRGINANRNTGGRVAKQQQNTYGKRLTSPQNTTQLPITISSSRGRTTPYLVDENRPRTTRAIQSIFERVDRNGHASYLGKGTWPQFESCLRECLSRDHQYSGITSLLQRHDISGSDIKRKGYVSLLDDYSYEKVVPYNSHRSLYTHHDYPTRSAAALNLEEIQGINKALSKSGISLLPHYQHHYDHHGHYHGHHPEHHYGHHLEHHHGHHPEHHHGHHPEHHHGHHLEHHHGHHPEHHHGHHLEHHHGHHSGHHYDDQHHHSSHGPCPAYCYGPNYAPPRHRIIGEIVTSCRIVNEEPYGSHSPSHTDRVNAVQHVWNALQHRQPFGTQVMGAPAQHHDYGAVRSVASHLFGGSHPSSPSHAPSHALPPPMFNVQTPFR
ncbi:unnamed protein product [Didymodactylos carnosus]|uniref:Uncharacterized protein n=1 Tax=Didymodactylos carnosus TaxID=1234261 RepID=A0A813NPI3_9BILA|nr:unnamed protein product [Didymodactylos carnosus]CAF3514750.1 unnamed protein product [Didymodactylos carnosus]